MTTQIKRWITKALPLQEKAKSLAEALNINAYLSAMLVQRGIETFDEAKEFFRPSLSIEKYIDGIFNSIPSTCFMVGVHIRRGDYETYLNGRFFFSFDQYKDLMLKIQSIHNEKNVHFINLRKNLYSRDSYTTTAAVLI